MTRADTGGTMKSTDLNIETQKSITLKCPIVVDDYMFDFFWLIGQYAESACFRIIDVKQAELQAKIYYSHIDILLICVLLSLSFLQ